MVSFDPFMQPGNVGLPDSGRRRTPGLRHEEVATLAGVSIDYLVRLEQGRDTRPSASVIAALANALHLDDEQTPAVVHAGDDQSISRAVHRPARWPARWRRQ